MKSSRALREIAEPLLLSSWSTLGLPFGQSPLQERGRGTIDPEVTILLTVLLAENKRVATDVPAWISRYSDLINHGKIRTLMRMLGDKHAKNTISKMRRQLFEVCPEAFKRSVGLAQGTISASKKRELQARKEKIAPVKALAESSLLINNRLLYGTTFRADIISLINAVANPLQVTQFARILACRESTISRVLFDLRAVGMIDRYNQLSKRKRMGCGLFISVATLRNILNLIDAMEFSSEELRRSTISEMDLRFDGFTRMLLAE